MPRGSALQRPVQPDEILGDIVGHRPLPRTQIVKKVWVYIKKHDLQDPDDRRMIEADSLLRPLFGGKSRVSMLALAGYIADHVE